MGRRRARAFGRQSAGAVPPSVVRSSLLTLLVLALLLAPAPLHAWSESTQVEIATMAARLAPPDLARQIEKHKGRLREGVLAPFRDGSPERHEKNADGSGTLDRAVVEEARRAIDLIRKPRPFADVVHQLGVLLHFVSDANQPLNVGADDPREGTYAADYLRYLQTAEPRFAAAYYGSDQRLARIDALPAFVGRSIARSRALYPFVGAEYRRIGGRSGVGAFDDRSTAFGVGAVCFSRALTDGAAVLRLVWLEAGGADSLRRPSLDSDRIVKLKRRDPSIKSP